MQWARTPRRGGVWLEHGRREGEALTRIDVGGNEGFAIGADDGMLGGEEMEREPNESSRVEELRDEFEAVKDEMVVPMMKMKEHLWAIYKGQSGSDSWSQKGVYRNEPTNLRFFVEILPSRSFIRQHPSKFLNPLF